MWNIYDAKYILEHVELHGSWRDNINHLHIVGSETRLTTKSWKILHYKNHMGKWQ